MSDRVILTLAVLGGTGEEGQALTRRWSRAGYHVLVGSRTPDKAVRVAEQLNESLGTETIRGLGNSEAAGKCDIAVLTVPFHAHANILQSVRDQLAGKLLIDVTVPLDPENPSRFKVPRAGSASLAAAEILDPSTAVACAFQNVSHIYLKSDGPVPCDVLVCGSTPAAREQTLQLVEAAGLVGWDAGGIENSVVVEGLTAVLIGINKRHAIRHAGLRITGVQNP